MFLFGLSKKICAGPPGCYIVVMELMDSGAPVTINGVTKSSTSTTIFTSNSNTAAMSFHTDQLRDGSTFLAGLYFLHLQTWRFTWPCRR